MEEGFDRFFSKTKAIISAALVDSPESKAEINFTGALELGGGQLPAAMGPNIVRWPAPDL